MVEILHYIIDVITIFLAFFISYRFYKTYESTNEKSTQVLSIFFGLFALVITFEFLMHEVLLANFNLISPELADVVGETVREVVILIAMVVIAWVIFPRPYIRKQLRTEEQAKEQAEKKKVA